MSRTLLLVCLMRLLLHFMLQLQWANSMKGYLLDAHSHTHTHILSHSLTLSLILCSIFFFVFWFSFLALLVRRCWALSSRICHVFYGCLHRTMNARTQNAIATVLFIFVFSCNYICTSKSNIIFDDGCNIIRTIFARKKWTRTFSKSEWKRSGKWREREREE